MPKNKKLFHTSHNRYSPQGIATFSHYQVAFSDLAQAKERLEIFFENTHIPLEILLQQGHDGKGLVQIWLEGWALIVRRTNTIGQKQLQNFFRAFDILVESILQHVDHSQSAELLERVENTLSTLTLRALHQETALLMQWLQEKKHQVTAQSVGREFCGLRKEEEAKAGRANTPEKECRSGHVGASLGEPGFSHSHGLAKESGASGLDHIKAIDVQRLGFFDEQEIQAKGEPFLHHYNQRSASAALSGGVRNERPSQPTACNGNLHEEEETVCDDGWVLVPRG